MHSTEHRAVTQEKKNTPQFIFYGPRGCTYLCSAAPPLAARKSREVQPPTTMQWPELCLRLVLALSLQSAAGFLSPLPFLPRQNPVTGTSAGHRPAGSGAVFERRTSTAPTARRLLFLRSPGSQLTRPRCSRPCGLSAAAPSAALGGRGGGEQSRTAPSNTALAARAGDGGLQREGDGGEGAEKGGGWRQRVVRTVVSVFLRIRAVVAALGSRLGLGRWSKVKAACQHVSCVTHTPKPAWCCWRSRSGCGRLQAILAATHREYNEHDYCRLDRILF